MRSTWAGIFLLAAAATIASGCGSSDGYRTAGCTPATDGRSVARVRDEALLDAIRRDVPAPTTHARNLFHLSAAMWDAWAAYDPDADGVFVTEKAASDDPAGARIAAISYAAYRLLLARYAGASHLQETFDELTATMEQLCYRIDFVETEGASPAALGNRIAEAVLAAGRDDGSLEDVHYVDTSYTPANEPLVVAQPGNVMHDATLWQPLALDRIVAQNGIAIPAKVQSFIGAQWGQVRAFALPPSRRGLPLELGEPPTASGPESDAYKQAALDVIRFSSELDPSDGITVDISPGAYGNNVLGTNDGTGYATNPVTGEPYAPNPVARGDLGRVLAEFWADGPNSETPPGHWNVIANQVSDALDERRVGGRGPVLDRLEWDVKLYLALNGAVHDAAIAAWGAKRFFDSVRPISMIRELATAGQSSDPGAPAYDLVGLPLEPGLVELVTRGSSAPNGRHEALADHVGEVAIRAWRGSSLAEPGARAGVGWILAAEWVPYQRPTFVTPAFPGYVSGHSTFSRAAAEVLTAFTGSAFFPGGLFEQRVAAGALGFEHGPETDVTLQWARYADAADQAGISRLYGGIHIAADDLAGRRMGANVGRRAWKRAALYFAGTARP